MFSPANNWEFSQRGLSMKSLHSRSSFYKAGSFLGFCSLLAILTVPAQAQRTGENITSLSDVSGPFIGNIHSEIVPVPVPPGTNLRITTIDVLNHEILTSPQEPTLGRIPKICIHLSESMAQTAPFSGCLHIDWKAYNRAISDTKELNRELTRLVQVQRTALAANPSPEERTTIMQRLDLLDKTTSVLESNVQSLVILGKAIDKAR